VDIEMALNFASNHDNLKLALSDFNQSDVAPAGPEVLRKPEMPKLEIEP